MVATIARVVETAGSISKQPKISAKQPRVETPIFAAYPHRLPDMHLYC
jgi:hypothetical protein